MHRVVMLVAVAVIVAGCFVYSNPLTTAEPVLRVLPKETNITEQNSDAIRGKTIRWTFTNGPMAGVPVGHTFNEDGSVIWRVVGGHMNGASKQEKEYAAVKISEDVYAVSYLAASGHTLTVVLNFKDKRMTGFGSNEKSWTAMKGTFDIAK